MRYVSTNATHDIAGEIQDPQEYARAVIGTLGHKGLIISTERDDWRGALAKVRGD